MKSAPVSHFALRAADGLTTRVREAVSRPVTDFVEQGVGGGRHCGWLAGRVYAHVQTRVTRVTRMTVCRNASALEVGCAR